MLQKAVSQYVASPLGYNTLLSALKRRGPTVEKFLQIAKLVRENKVCTVQTKLFVSKSSKVNKNIKHNVDTKRDITPNTDVVLANITSFQGYWIRRNNSGPMMKVYNSFNYTQDVKYEARLLELPLKSDCKLVLLVPNEEDDLQCSFETLKHQGVDAAVRSLQPLFTTSCDLHAPNVDVVSRVEHLETENVLANSKMVEYGSLLVNEKGATIRVLTCLTSPANTSKADHHQNTDQIFYFALVYQDMPIFVGQFSK